MGSPKELTAALKKPILEAVVAGAKPEVAMVGNGVSRATFYRWRSSAAEGKSPYAEFFEEIDQAEAQCEINDILVTQTAAISPDETFLECPKCNEPIQWKVVERIEAVQRVLSNAAKTAFERLGRRFPTRWSPAVRHTVEDEQKEFLDVAQEVLSPEIFQLLLNAYSGKISTRETSATTTQH